MSMLALILLIQDPSAEQIALGRRLAEAGTLAALLPIKVASDTEELLAEHPEWSDADKAALRATAGEQAEAATERLIDATGRAYAARLSIEDMRVLVAFNDSPLAKRGRAATPAVILETMAKVGELDFKGDTRKAFCAKTGKGCPAK